MAKMLRNNKQIKCLSVLLFYLFANPLSRAQELDLIPLPQLAQLDLPALMQMDVMVTSVAKKPQRLSDTAAAVYVMSSEDIRRSGASTIPDLLRMVPGVNVAQFDFKDWVVSARGFNDFFASKLLVLIDGRSVYTPLFSGVYWDAQDLLIQDIDRIEVIRGPGGTVWGANAVNGVINIITKKAAQTQGGLVVAGAGNQQQSLIAARYGGQLNDDTHYRFFVKGQQKDSLLSDVLIGNLDGLQGGFRIDWEPKKEDAFSLQGSLYRQSFDVEDYVRVLPVEPFFEFFDFKESLGGGHLLGEWHHQFSADSDTLLRAYYDRTWRDEAFLEQRFDTVDIDFRHRWRINTTHEVIWGLGYRHIRDELKGPDDVIFSFLFDATKQNVNLYSVFLQDEMALGDNLTLTLGSKFEHNDYTGFEIQPSLRALWAPQEGHSIWAAVSRAVRTPSRLERTGKQLFDYFPPDEFSPPVQVTTGNQGPILFDSEVLIAYELGYRWQPSHQLMMDMAAYYNDYDRLRSFDFGEPLIGDDLVEERIFVANNLAGKSYGLELNIEWQVQPNWRLMAAYTYQKIQLHPIVTSDDPFLERGEYDEANTPQQQASLRSSWNLTPKLEWDVWLRYVDKLPALGDPEQGGLIGVDSYTTLDTQLSWRPDDNITVSIGGRNLLDRGHLEDRGGAPVEAEFYGRLEWRF